MFIIKINLQISIVITYDEIDKNVLLRYSSNIVFLLNFQACCDLLGKTFCEEKLVRYISKNVYEQHVIMILLVGIKRISFIIPFKYMFIL